MEMVLRPLGVLKKRQLNRLVEFSPKVPCKLMESAYSDTFCLCIIRWPRRLLLLDEEIIPMVLPISVEHCGFYHTGR